MVNCTTAKMEKGYIYDFENFQVLDGRKNASSFYEAIVKAEKDAYISKRYHARRKAAGKREKFVNDVKFTLGLTCVTVLPMLVMIIHYCLTSGY